MSSAGQADLGGGLVARWRFTDRADGDFAVDGEPTALAARRQGLVPAPWTWLHQVHGREVVVVDHAGQHAGAEADAAVTVAVGAPLAVQTADCGPVLLMSSEGVIGAAHAGWRGLAEGVLDATVGAMRSLGAGQLRAVVGPMIHAGCYEFGAEDLDLVASVLGPDVRGRTTTGAPALDVPRAVERSLARLGVVLAGASPGCTACDPAYFSHRARQESGRMAAVIWLDRASAS